MDEPTQYDIKITAGSGLQGRQVIVDGEDISNHLEAIEFSMSYRDLATVVLHLTPGSTLFEGKAVVALARQVNGQIINDLNPEQIEAEAMSREPNDKRFIENVVDVIKEKLGAAD